MKKRLNLLKKIRVKYLLFLLAICFSFRYCYINILKNKSFHQYMNTYFGLTIIPLIFILLLLLYSHFLKSVKQKMICRVRIFFFALLLFFGMLLFMMLKLKIPFDNSILDSNKTEDILNFMLYEYNFGFILTFFYLTLLYYLKYSWIYLISSTIIIISLFFLIARKIRKFIVNIIEIRRKKKRLAIEKKLIQEQIELQEKLERGGLE